MIKINGVSKCYNDDKDNEVIALKDINIDFPDKGLVIITGSSGCGKTTLLNIIAGLDKPTEGSVYFENERVDDKNEKWWDSFRSGYLGFIYQDFNLLDDFTVEYNISLPLLIRSERQSIIDDKIKNISKKLGIEDLLQKRCGKLSGGQKQRVAIARSIITETSVILADEPTGNLDEINSENVFSILKNVSKDKLVIVVTHDEKMAQRYADYIINISYGNIVSDNKLNSTSISNKKIEINKTRLPFRERIKYVNNTLKKRKFRCVVSIFIFSIIILGLLITNEAIQRNDGKRIVADIEKNNQNLIHLYTNVPDRFSKFTVDGIVDNGELFYKDLCKILDSSRILKRKNSSVIIDEKTVFLSSTIYYNEANTKYFTIEGKLPEKNNEVAVSPTIRKYFAKSDSIIGNKIYIDEQEYIITAIVKNIGSCETEYIKSSSDSESNTVENLIFLPEKYLASKDKYSTVTLSGFTTIRNANLSLFSSSYSNVAKLDSISKLISGRMPENSSEILISEATYNLLNNLPYNIIGTTYTLKDLYKSDYGRIFWNHINIYDYFGEKITIVGVASGYGNYYIDNKIYDQLYDLYYRYYNMEYVLINDKKYIENDIISLTNKNYRVEGLNYTYLYSFIDNLNGSKKAIYVVEAVISILAVLQMISLFSYSISDNCRTIGILRTLGVNKEDTKKIFTLECLIVSVVSFAIAIVFNIVVLKIMNGYINDNIINIDDFNLIVIRIIPIMIICLLTVIFSAFSVIIPLNKFSKKKIIQLLK